MRSAIYVGEVWHRRNLPRSHELRYRVAMPYISMDEVDEVLGMHPLWSERAGAPMRWRAQDYLPSPGLPSPGSAGALAERARDRVGELCGRRPAGAVALLANWRTLGWSFNPLSLYYCFDPGGDLAAVLGEVTNTPWGERQTYLFGLSGTLERKMDKGMHVSPFCGMDQSYRVVAPEPGSSLRVRVDVVEAGQLVIETKLALERRELSRASMTAMLLRHPAMAQRVSAGIYSNAASLWAKGVPYHRHPPKSKSSGCPMGAVAPGTEQARSGGAGSGAGGAGAGGAGARKVSA